MFLLVCSIDIVRGIQRTFLRLSDAESLKGLAASLREGEGCRKEILLNSGGRDWNIDSQGNIKNIFSDSANLNVRAMIGRHIGNA